MSEADAEYDDTIVFGFMLLFKWYCVYPRVNPCRFQQVPPFFEKYLNNDWMKFPVGWFGSESSEDKSDDLLSLSIYDSDLWPFVDIPLICFADYV